LIGADHLAGAGLNSLWATRHPTVRVLHGGDARDDHLKGGIERVEIEIDPPQVFVISVAGQRPSLKFSAAKIGKTFLQGCTTFNTRAS
jgi:hypothetical protein